MKCLCILPRVEYKFKSQYSDPINGSDLVHISFGANAANIFKLFKKLFVVQYPMVHIPSRKQAPNHKVDHLFSCLIQVSAKTFELCCNISSDKQDAIFQGHIKDKHRVTFKRVGDGFLIAAVFKDGYTINFYPSNIPPPNNWI